MRSLTRFCLDYFPHSLAGHVQLRHCQMRHQCHTSHITCCHTFASTATRTLLLGMCSCATAKCATNVTHHTSHVVTPSPPPPPSLSCWASAAAPRPNARPKSHITHHMLTHLCLHRHPHSLAGHLQLRHSQMRNHRCVSLLG